MNFKNHSINFLEVSPNHPNAIKARAINDLTYGANRSENSVIISRRTVPATMFKLMLTFLK